MVTQISPSIVDRVLLHFAAYGEIHQWVSLEKSFARIIIVYKHEDDAERAKSQCGDRLVLEATKEKYVRLSKISAICSFISIYLDQERQWEYIAQ